MRNLPEYPGIAERCPPDHHGITASLREHCGRILGVTHIAVEVVHVQTSRSECESCRGADIFDCLVQAEGNEHAAAARLTDSEHSFAIAYIYEAVGCVRQLDQGIGSRS